jgi:hypothetical protein
MLGSLRTKPRPEPSYMNLVFLKYLELQRKFRKLLLFIDRAVQHRNSIMVRKHLEENKDVIRVEYLPKAHLIIMPLKRMLETGREEMIFWYQNTIQNSSIQKSAIANYYRTRRFKIDIAKYLFRKDR